MIYLPMNVFLSSDVYQRYHFDGHTFETNIRKESRQMICNDSSYTFNYLYLIIFYLSS